MVWILTKTDPPELISLDGFHNLYVSPGTRVVKNEDPEREASQAYRPEESYFITALRFVRSQPEDTQTSTRLGHYEDENVAQDVLRRIAKAIEGGASLVDLTET